MDTNRRDFIRASIATVLGAGLSVSIAGCGYDDGESTTGACGDFEWTIGGNHGHECAAINTQFTEGLTLSIQGSSGHDHTITLTVADLTALQAPGGKVSTTSSTSGGHDHAITLTRLG
jgi:hypothetical protein